MYQTLKEIGLEENEITVYLKLLSIGTTSASVLSYQTGIPRSTTHNLCGQLAKKGLIHSAKNKNTTSYTSESPDKLQFLLDRQKTELDEKQERINRIIGDLKIIENPDIMLPKVRFYDGFDGIKQVYEDTLKEKHDICAFEHSFRTDYVSEEMPKYIDNYYLPARLRQGLKAYVIMPETEKNIQCKKDDQKYSRQTKFISEIVFPIEVEVNIYGKKTAFLSYRKDEMFAMIIDSPGITCSMKAIFDVMWNVAS